MKHAKTVSNEVSSVRILKAATCPSLSGKSTLTYHIGGNSESDILLRVVANTGGGFFNNEWVSFNAIQGVFDKQPQDKPIVSLILLPLFQGRSMNSPAFLLAAIKAEGLVKPLGDKKRGYERVDSTEFMNEVRKLMSSLVDLRVAESTVQQTKPGKKSKSNLEKATVPAS